MNDHYKDLTDAARCLARISNPATSSEGFEGYLREVQDLVGADSGHAFFLNLATAFFEQVAPKENHLEPIPADSILEVGVDVAQLRPVVLGVLSERSAGGEAPVGLEHRIIVPLIREKLIGFLALARTAARPPFAPREVGLARALAPGFVWLRDKQQALDLFAAQHQPIDYLRSREKFFQDLIAQVSLASGMPFLAIREYNAEEDVLRCLASMGFNVSSNEDLDLRQVADYPTFARAMAERQPVVEYDMKAPHLKNVVSNPYFSNIKSFVVVPVLVGMEVFGTLGFACSVTYEFTALELAGFETIASGAGLAIRNFRSVRESESSASEKARRSMAFTAVEIAQVARHEAMQFIENMKTIISIMEAKIPSALRDTVGQLSKNLAATTQAVNRIKSATRPLKRELSKRSLVKLWNEVFEDVHLKLEMEQIRWDVVGKESVEVYVYPDHLRHAFINLLLNSIDAFCSQSKKSNRKITVEVMTPSEAANKIQMTYTDNAGGIDPSRLILSDEVRQQLEQDGKDISAALVFRAGVTSKDTGGGYGLWLVQKIMDEHFGSIDLNSHRGGVQFLLSVPRDLKPVSRSNVAEVGG